MWHRTQGFVVLSMVMLLVLTGGRAEGDSPRGEGAKGRPQWPYQDASLPVERRVDDLIARMTLDEKVGQLVQISAHGTDEALYDGMARKGTVGSFLNVAFNGVDVNAQGVYGANPRQGDVRSADRTNRLQRAAVEGTRLGIPLLFAHDVIHGFRTIFPVPLAEAASFDPSSAERSARVAAVEASAVGLKWTFAPMVDIARDPRWGRIVEGSGEDPVLGVAMATARVRGFQGASLADPESIMATVKHYAGYGGAEGGRDYNTVDISDRTLREVYLPPFLAGVRAGAESFMVSFNEIGGVPSSASPYLVRRILRGEWKWQGLVVSDWGSIGELVDHGVAETPAQAAILGMGGGVDIDMESPSYAPNLARLVREGQVPLSQVDEAVRNVLRSKFRCGLFERPYVDSTRVAQVMMCPEHVRAAREIARRSIVLLKNENDILPLRKDLGTLAVIGPLADDRRAPLGSWRCAGQAADVVTVLEGLRQAVSPATRILHERGCELEGGDLRGIEAAVAAARQADAVVLVVGESAEMSGEMKSRSSLDLPGHQQRLVEAVQAVGKPVVVVLMNGRPLALPWMAAHVPAIVETWFLGSQAGLAVADVLMGDSNPAGRLPVTFPRSVGQVPLYYNHKNTGRPKISRYLDITDGPLYPFGHGLSYTRFAYRNLRVSPRRARVGDSLQVDVDVQNVGKRAGDEVVQVYTHQRVGASTRPVLELKAFRRTRIEPGAVETVSFRLPVEDLATWDEAAHRFRVEPGRFDLQVGPSSASGLKEVFDVTAAGSTSRQGAEARSVFLPARTCRARSS